jgi:hypothetical protein
MILLLRGHIRNSFKDDKLYHLIETIYKHIPNLSIYIHTWNIYANTISWRRVEGNDYPVSDIDIYNYFKDLKHLIQHIIIEDDSNINLIGKTDGLIGKSRVPILGWKNYWYGKYQIINYMKEHLDPLSTNENIINCRFDVLENSNSIQADSILPFILSHHEKSLHKNMFLYTHECVGIDNIYIGNINTMYTLIRTFFYELDDIIRSYPNIGNPENLVFRQSAKMVSQ